jgi:long-chain acyl-CoA synthetase
MLEVQTLNDVLTSLAGRGDKTVALYKSGTDWKPISGNQIYGRVRAFADALQSWGVQRGDRVAMVGENRWEWLVTDLAILSIGAVTVPLYQTLPPEQVGYMLRDSGAKVFVGSGKAQYDKIAAAGEMPALERVVIWDDGDFGNADSFSAIMQRAPELETRDAAFDAMLAQTRPEDAATIIYTSGTTGEPKGVLLTHDNMASNLRYSTDGLQINAEDVSISYLPLSHALARHQDYAFYLRGAQIAYLPKFDDLRGAMASIRPTVLVGVPRVFEKVRQGVESKSSHGFTHTIFAWALKEGARHRDEVAAGKLPTSLGWKLADKLVFSKIREAFGGRAKLFISGGAPLGKENNDWFLAVGIRIFEGYGLTETAPVMARNTFDGYRAGTVGTLLENLEVRLASDGEIETRGPNVFKAYWNKDEATKKEFTDDGWFKTGDIGKIEDGFLSVTDRKKELMKTSGGKYVAPQPIESKLKVDSLVEQAALIGDQKKFVSAIISPNFPALERWAKRNGVSAQDHAALVKDEKVRKAYDDLAKKANEGLGHHETIKKLILVPDAWTVESGELTPSMKLKRRVITEKYKDQIAEVYREK